MEIEEGDGLQWYDATVSNYSLDGKYAKAPLSNILRIWDPDDEDDEDKVIYDSGWLKVHGVVKLEYKPSQQICETVSGFPKGCFPSGKIIRGGNGTYVLRHGFTNAELWVYVCENGILYRQDIYYKVKKLMSGARLTPKRRMLLKRKMREMSSEFSVETFDSWVESAIRASKI